MFHVLADTCVWLDMAQDPKQTPLLLVVENMVRKDLMRLLVPRVVIDEFKRNRTRVAQASARSLKGHVAQVKEAINRVDGNARRKKALLAHLDDLNHRAPIVGGVAQTTLSRIEKLFDTVAVVEATDAAKLQAAERALLKKAPCHHDNKNSLADALVLEMYFEAVQAVDAYCDSTLVDRRPGAAPAAEKGRRPCASWSTGSTRPSRRWKPASLRTSRRARRRPSSRACGRRPRPGARRSHPEHADVD